MSVGWPLAGSYAQGINIYWTSTIQEYGHNEDRIVDKRNRHHDRRGPPPRGNRWRRWPAKWPLLWASHPNKLADIGPSTGQIVGDMDRHQMTEYAFLGVDTNLGGVTEQVHEAPCRDSVTMTKRG